VKVFLSFASEDRPAAERIYLALLGADHEVFFDEASLPAGSDYNSRIREAIYQCDLYLYLISDASVGHGRYVHSELSLVKAKWPKPWGRVLPVMLGRVEVEEVDPYLASATMLKPEGNVEAEVVAAIPAMRSQIFRRRMLPTVCVVSAVGVFGIVGYGFSHLSHDNARSIQSFDTTHLYLEDTDGHPILGDFEVIVRTSNGQQILEAKDGTAAVEIPTGRTDVYVHVTMEQYAMLERPPLPINDSTVRIVMVDRAIPASVPPDLDLPAPSDAPPIASPSSNNDRLLRVRFQNDFKETFKIFLWSQGSKEYQQIILAPGNIQILELKSSRDTRYRMTLQSAKGILYEVGWFDSGKFDEDVIINLSNILL